MNVVKVSNKIALATVVLLMYWVFIFICSTVFGFKVFQENMTEMFLLSILGIFSILSGAIILNIMFNLTAIADGRGIEKKENTSASKKTMFIFLSSLVVIFVFMYAGDVATSKKREKYLVSSAADLLAEQKDIIDSLSNYSFTREYIKNASQDLKILSKVEEKFPQVTVISRDSSRGNSLLLGFTSYSGLDKDVEPLKANFILSTSSEERKYLNSVFDGFVATHRFSSNDGRYEIYYPVKTENGQIVIHLSEFSRYGKFGS